MSNFETENTVRSRYYAQKWAFVLSTKMSSNNIEVSLPAELSLSFRDQDGTFHIYHGTVFKIVDGRLIATVDASSETSTWKPNSRHDGHPMSALLPPAAPRPPYGPPVIDDEHSSSETLGSQDTEEEQEEEIEEEDEEESTNTLIASSDESDSSSVLRLRGPSQVKRGRSPNQNGHWISKRRKTRSDKGKPRGIECPICLNGREILHQCKNERCGMLMCLPCFEGVRKAGSSDPLVCAFCRTDL